MYSTRGVTLLGGGQGRGLVNHWRTYIALKRGFHFAFTGWLGLPGDPLMTCDIVGLFASIDHTPPRPFHDTQ